MAWFVTMITFCEREMQQHYTDLHQSSENSHQPVFSAAGPLPPCSQPAHSQEPCQNRQRKLRGFHVPGTFKNILLHYKYSTNLCVHIHILNIFYQLPKYLLVIYLSTQQLRIHRSQDDTGHTSDFLHQTYSDTVQSAHHTMNSQIPCCHTHKEHSPVQY